MYPLLCTAFPQVVPFPSKAPVQADQEESEISSSINSSFHNGVSGHPPCLTLRETFFKKFSIKGSNLPQGNPRRILHPNLPRIHRAHKVTRSKWLLSSHPTSNGKNLWNEWEWIPFPLNPNIIYSCSLFLKWNSKKYSPTTWELRIQT
jgi:hypothetical protein